jgi:hypothetical protein
LPCDDACGCAAQSVATTFRKADVGEPGRPQAKRGIGEQIDNAFHDLFRGRCRFNSHQQRALMVRSMIDLIKQCAKAHTVDAAERKDRSHWCAEEKFGGRG